MMARKITKSNHTYNITLAISPQVLDVGQMLQVSVVFTNQYAQPVFVKEIFMEIIDSTGRVAWPLSVMERGSSGFAKLISTRELQPNTRYTIRIADNSNLVNHRFGYFKTSKRKLPLALIPVLLAPYLITPLVPKKAQIPILYVYRTELDGKVCDICRPYEGRSFKPNDPDMIRIGPEELGGETHWRCRCHYDMRLVINPAYAKVLMALKAIKAIKAIEGIKKLKSKEITIKT